MDSLLSQSNLKIHPYISTRALNRFKKDLFVKQNKKWYIQQIFLLIQSRLDRPTETLGKFLLTPRGHETKRIAFHFEIKDDTLSLYIDDLLYHRSNGEYVDNWNQKVRSGKITLKTYNMYVPYENL